MANEKERCSECGQEKPKKEFRMGEGPILTAREIEMLTKADRRKRGPKGRP